MNEQQIIELIKNDPWMMDVLNIAKVLNLPDWIIGAGFVRNKVWNHLHQIDNQKHDTDIDLVYFDKNGNDEKGDIELTNKIRKETGMDWEIINESYAHKWNNFKPFKSTEDAIAHWSETATGVGVTIKNGELVLVAPHGIKDLVNLIIKPSPYCLDKTNIITERVKNKRWLEKWPKLKLSRELM